MSIVTFDVKNWKCWVALTSSVALVVLPLITSLFILPANAVGVLKIVEAAIGVVCVNLGITLLTDKK